MKTLEHMRRTLPNTDQPRIPLSEYQYILLCRLLIIGVEL